MKHLVLGSSGQVGSHLVNYLKLNKQEVIEWDIELSNIYDLSDKKITDTYLNYAMEQSDFVHFLAFDVGGSKYLEKYQDTYKFINNNINLMNNVFSILEKNNKPFYFASSQMSNMFNSTYGRLKAVGESYTKSLNGLNIRFWNVFGVENNPEKTHVITDFVRMALNNKKIVMRTNGNESRNFLYADDAVKMLYNCSISFFDKNKLDYLKSLEKKFDAIPICADQNNTITIKGIAEIVDNLLDNLNEIIIGDKVDIIQPIVNNIPSFSNEELQFLLQEKKFTSIKEGISKIIEKEKLK